MTVGQAMAEVTRSSTWQEYRRWNPKATLGIVELSTGATIFVVYSPVSGGYEQVFLTVDDAINFAYVELLAYACCEQMEAKLREGKRHDEMLSVSQNERG
jgi:hypothetical protein